MAVKFYNFSEKRYEEPQYVGAVLKIYEHYWLDGMTEEIAVLWNSEEQKIEHTQVGYYGSDGQNMNKTKAEVDATPETWRQVLRSLKPNAYKAYVDSVLSHKSKITAGMRAEVVKGRKVPKGTLVDVFWVGEKPTFQSRRYSWVHETETVAGCYDVSGNKLWIKAEYLKNLGEIKSPNAKERRDYIKAYVEQKAHELGAPWVRR